MFRKILRSTSSNFNWYLLEDLKSLDLINKQSSNSEIKAIIIFKHSTRCGTSLMAKRHLQQNWIQDTSIPLYYLDLIRFRDISNKIEILYDVMHQSPQVLVIKNQKCVYDASHNAISVDKILEHVSD